MFRGIGSINNSLSAILKDRTCIPMRMHLRCTHMPIVAPGQGGPPAACAALGLGGVEGVRRHGGGVHRAALRAVRHRLLPRLAASPGWTVGASRHPGKDALQDQPILKGCAKTGLSGKDEQRPASLKRTRKNRRPIWKERARNSLSASDPKFQVSSVLHVWDMRSYHIRCKKTPKALQ